MRRAGRRIAANPHRDGSRRLAVFLAVFNAMRGHVIPWGKCRHCTVLRRSRLTGDPAPARRASPTHKFSRRSIRVKQLQAPHTPPLTQLGLQGPGHVGDLHGIRLACVLGHSLDRLQSLTVVLGQRGMQAQREPQPPSFPCRLEKPVRPESLSAPRIPCFSRHDRRHRARSTSTG